MCLIACAWRADPRFELILIANRDEMHTRASLPAATHPEAPEIIGGRDAVAGGSWLQFSTRDRLAAVTNVRAGAPGTARPRSRGALVTRFVRDALPAQAFIEQIAPQAADYGRFNLLLWDATELRLATNFPTFSQFVLRPGLHVLSNGPFGVPWPKTERIHAGLRDWLLHTPPLDGAVDYEPLFSLLAERSQPEDAALPDTGVGIQHERLLAPIFVLDPRYGTRCSTVVARASDGRWWFEERRYGPGGQQEGVSVLSGGPR